MNYRKLDAIVFRVDEKKSINMQYQGGMNCKSKISSPLHQQLDNNNGDSGLILTEEDSILLN